jgi:hypothetical protein
MSFEPDDEYIKIRQIREELKDLRMERAVFNEGVEITTNTGIMGTSTGMGSMNHGSWGDILQPITNVLNNIEAGINSIDIVGSFQTVSAAVGEGVDAFVHYINSEFEGLSVTLRPAAGQTLCLVANATPNLSTQGNIMLTNDLVLNDEQVAKFKFQNDKQYADGHGGWVLESTTSAVGSSFPILYPEDDLGIVGGTSILINISGSTGHFKQMTLNDDIELGFTSPPASTVFFEFWVQITQDGTGGHSIIGTDVNLKNGASFDGLLDKDPNAVTIFHFTTGDGGVSYHGELVDIDLAGEVFTWTADHDADGNNLLNANSVQTDRTTKSSVGFVRMAYDEWIGWRDITDSVDALWRFNASDEFEWRIGATPVLTVGINTTDFEQNNLIRVANIDSFTGDFSIGFTDPFHQIIGRRLIPSSVAEYFTGTDGDLRKEQLHTYIDVKVGGSFDIRENGHGPDVSLLAGTDPWFRFRKLSGGAVMQLFSNSFDDTKIVWSANQADRGEIYYNELGNDFIIDKKGGTLTEGTVLATDGLQRFASYTGWNVSFQELNMLQNDITFVDRLEFGEFSGVLNGLSNKTIYISSADSGAMVFNNSASSFLWTHENVVGLVEDGLQLTKIGLVAPTFTLYNNRAPQTGTAGLISFSANMVSQFGSVTAFISSDTETSTGFGSGSMAVGVLESGVPQIYMRFNDNNTQEIKIERDIDMSLGEIRGILSMDFDGSGGIQGLTSLDFFHTGNTIFSLTDMFYTTDALRKHEFQIGGVQEYSFERFGLDIHTNYIRFDGTSGLATQLGEPKLFANSLNLDHLSIKSGDGSIIDLESGGGGSTSFVAFTADADLNMGLFDIKTTIDPSVNIFRVIFDGHLDSDTYISNSTTEDRINIWRNGANTVAFTAVSNFFTDINMQGNSITSVDDITASGSGSVLQMNGGQMFGVSFFSMFNSLSTFGMANGTLTAVGTLSMNNSSSVLQMQGGRLEMGEGDINNLDVLTFRSGGLLNMNNNNITNCFDLTVNDDITLGDDLLMSNGNITGVAFLLVNTQLQMSGSISMGGNNIFSIGTVSASGKGTFAEVEINGNLNHDGSNIGYFGKSPRSKQTYFASFGVLDGAFALQAMGNYGWITTNI